MCNEIPTNSYFVSWEDLTPDCVKELLNDYPDRKIEYQSGYYKVYVIKEISRQDSTARWTVKFLKSDIVIRSSTSYDLDTLLLEEKLGIINTVNYHLKSIKKTFKEMVE